MLKPFLCGAFSPEIDDESPNFTSVSSPYSTPRKPRVRFRCQTKNNKNPYSTRGLDKFSALLAELEQKRQKIYSQMDSQDIVVRFVYKNSDECVPVVVKQRDRKGIKNRVGETKIKSEILEAMAEPKFKPAQTERNRPISVAETGKISEKKSSSHILNLKRWKRPSNYLPAIIILILLVLAIFGRSVAILCTSIGWYVVPSLKETSNPKRPTKKKDLTRRCSENKMVVNRLSSPSRNNIA